MTLVIPGNFLSLHALIEEVSIEFAHQSEASPQEVAVLLEKLGVVLARADGGLRQVNCWDGRIRLSYALLRDVYGALLGWRMGSSAGVRVGTSLADLVLAIDFFQDSFKADVLSHSRPLFLFGRLSGASTSEHPLACLLYLEDLLIELALC